MHSREAVQSSLKTIPKPSVTISTSVSIRGEGTEDTSSNLWCCILRRSHCTFLHRNCRRPNHRRKETDTAILTISIPSSPFQSSNLCLVICTEPHFSDLNKDVRGVCSFPQWHCERGFDCHVTSSWYFAIFVPMYSSHWITQGIEFRFPLVDPQMQPCRPN